MIIFQLHARALRLHVAVAAVAKVLVVRRPKVRKPRQKQQSEKRSD
jgi:hypothetical protein